VVQVHSDSRSALWIERTECHFSNDLLHVAVPVVPSASYGGRVTVLLQ